MQNKKLQEENELLIKRLKILEGLSIKTSHRHEKTLVENGILEEKVNSLSKITGASAEFSMEELKIRSIAINLSNAIYEYMEPGGRVCSKHNVQLVCQSTLELQSDFAPIE